MRIAVTGASGFIGGHIMRSLNADHAVVGFSRRPLPDQDTYAWRETDITKPFSFDGSFDVVIHVAAVADLQATMRQAKAINETGTKHVVSAAKKASVKHCIFISTASVYDVTKNKKNVTEDFAKLSNENNAYSITKYAAERLIVHSGLPYTILRPHAVYGPCDASILPGLYENIRGKILPLPIADSKEVSTTFVGNICSVVSQLLARQQLESEIYNIVDKEMTTNIDFIQSLLSVKGGVRLVKLPPGVVKRLITILPLLKIDRPTIDQLNMDSSLSVEKLQNDGYELPYTREQGLRDLRDWYQDSPDYAKSNAQSKKVWPNYQKSPLY